MRKQALKDSRAPDSSYLSSKMTPGEEIFKSLPKALLDSRKSDISNSASSVWCLLGVGKVGRERRGAGATWQSGRKRCFLGEKQSPVL